MTNDNSILSDDTDKLRALKSIYELTIKNNNFLYTKSSIEDNIPQTLEEKLDISFLIKDWIMKGYVQSETISPSPNPANHRQLKTGYRANLYRLNEIEEIINKAEN